MNFNKFKITNKGLYWGLIVTFGILYACVGFVSTLHSITFFHLANTMGLAVLLGLTYEIGQASVLFSILMTKNKDKFLPWALMILLTALQVSANVYASFKYMVSSGSNDWVYWQKSILFGVQAATPEMYQVIISWISGALLPVVALGMTALVANNMKLMSDENEEPSVQEEEITDEEQKEFEEARSNLKKDSEDYEEQSQDKLEKEKQAELLLLQGEKLKPQIAPSLKDAVIQESALQDEINDELKDFLDKPEDENINKDEFNKIGEKLKEEYERLNNANNPFLRFDNESKNIVDRKLSDVYPDIKMKTSYEKVVPQVEIEIPTKIMDGFVREEPDGWNKEPIDVSFEKPMTREFEEPENNVDDFEPILEEKSEDLTEEDLNQIYEMMNEKQSEKLVDTEISKELIVPPKKKAGRPPKKKDEMVAEPKKEKELLLKEEVKVPAKRKRASNPLKKKTKIRRIKTIDEINPPSKGDEVIALIENIEKEKDKESINNILEETQKSQESLLVPPEILTPYIENGVEVIDAKAVTKKEGKVDKFGIPIQPGERKNFDRI